MSNNSYLTLFLIYTELAESLMMPVLSCEGRTNPEIGPMKPETNPLKPELKPVKPELKPVKTEMKPSKQEIKASIQETISIQEPPVLIPADSSFSNSAGLTNNPQSLIISPQMVHVEKPKAENLQACSVAFMPVAPVFPKENINTPTVYPPPPPLLSCQAFECFDVLTSIMQASGYQVAPQIGMPQAFDTPANMYSFKNQRKAGNVQRMHNNFPPKLWNMKLGRKRRRGKPQKMEALNLSKKMHTKPIVSATLANSITQLKVEGITSSDRKPQFEATQTVPLCLVKPKSSKRIPCYKATTSTNTKGLDLSSPRPSTCESATSTQCSVIVSTSDSLKFNLAADYSKEKSKSSRKEKKIIADMLPDIYDFTDDSNLSTNLEASRIEKCAKEMLEFMNQKVEDTALNDPCTADISISKSEMDGIFQMLEAETGPEKYSNSKSSQDNIKVDNTICKKEKENALKVPLEIKNTTDDSKTQIKEETNKNDPSMDVALLESINQLSKDSATEFMLFYPKFEDVDNETGIGKEMISDVPPNICEGTSQGTNEIFANEKEITTAAGNEDFESDRKPDWEEYRNCNPPKRNINNAADKTDTQISNDNASKDNNSKEEEKRVLSNDESYILQDNESNIINDDCNLSNDLILGDLNEENLIEKTSNEELCDTDNIPENTKGKDELLELQQVEGNELKNEPCLELTVEYCSEKEEYTALKSPHIDTIDEVSELQKENIITKKETNETGGEFTGATSQDINLNAEKKDSITMETEEPKVSTSECKSPKDMNCNMMKTERIVLIRLRDELKFQNKECFKIKSVNLTDERREMEED